jgi:hypothetical protein
MYDEDTQDKLEKMAFCCPICVVKQLSAADLVHFGVLLAKPYSALAIETLEQTTTTEIIRYNVTNGEIDSARA